MSSSNTDVEKFIIDGADFPIVDPVARTAEGTSFNNTGTTLSSTNTESAIKEVNNSLTQLLITRNYTKAYTLTANANLNITDSDFNISALSGYEMLSIAEFNSGNSYVYARRATIPTSQNNTVISLHNTDTSSQSGTASITFIFIKTFS